MKGKLRILHGMTEIAGQGSYSVKGLKALGCDARMVVRRENPSGYPCDYSLQIEKKKPMYPVYAWKIVSFALYAWKRFDVFHFHFGFTLLPCKIDIPIIKYLLRKPVFMEFHGSDIRWMFCQELPRFYPYKEPPEFKKRRVRMFRRMCRQVDGVILHDEELRKYLPDTATRVFMTPLRLEIRRFKPQYPAIGTGARPVVVHAPSNFAIKGTQYVLDAVDRLKARYEFDFVLVHGRTQEEALEIYQNADITIDQLVMGTHGVFALEAMAMGKPVITYISDEMRPHFPDELPIVSADITDVEEKLEMLLKDPELRAKIGMAGRKYVEDYHDCRKVAMLQRDIYLGKCRPMGQKEAYAYVKALTVPAGRPAGDEMNQEKTGLLGRPPGSGI